MKISAECCKICAVSGNDRRIAAEKRGSGIFKFILPPQGGCLDGDAVV